MGHLLTGLDLATPEGATPEGATPEGATPGRATPERTANKAVGDPGDIDGVC
jgi:hypothetical protein